MDPQKAKTIEAGVKWDALGGALALNAAIFQTTVTNEINSQILDEDGNPTQTGKKRVKRSEEHTSELQSLMRISYAVFCLKKKKTQANKSQPDNNTNTNNEHTTKPQANR